MNDNKQQSFMVLVPLVVIWVIYYTFEWINLWLKKRWILKQRPRYIVLGEDFKVEEKNQYYEQLKQFNEFKTQTQYQEESDHENKNQNENRLELDMQNQTFSPQNNNQQQFIRNFDNISPINQEKKFNEELGDQSQQIQSQVIDNQQEQNDQVSQNSRQSSQVHFPQFNLLKRAQSGYSDEYSPMSGGSDKSRLMKNQQQSSQMLESQGKLVESIIISDFTPKSDQSKQELNRDDSQSKKKSSIYSSFFQNHKKSQIIPIKDNLEIVKESNSNINSSNKNKEQKVSNSDNKIWDNNIQGNQQDQYQVPITSPQNYNQNETDQKFLINSDNNLRSNKSNLIEMSSVQSKKEESSQQKQSDKSTNNTDQNTSKTQQDWKKILEELILSLKWSKEKIDALKKQIDKLNKNLKKQIDNNKKLEQDKDKSEKIIQEKDIQLENLKQEKEELIIFLSDKTENEKKISSLLIDISILKDQLHQKENLINDQKIKEDKQEQKIKNIEKDNKQFYNQIQQLEQSNQDFQKKNKELNEQNENLKNKYNKAKKLYKDLEQINQNQTNELQNYREQLKELDELKHQLFQLQNKPKLENQEYVTPEQLKNELQNLTLQNQEKDKKIEKQIEKIKEVEIKLIMVEKERDEISKKNEETLNKLNSLLNSKSEEMNNVKAQHLKFFEAKYLSEGIQASQIHQSTNLELKKLKIDNKEYIGKIYQQVALDKFYNYAIQTIFTQMISNFDEDPEKECLFVKIRGISMQFDNKKGKWGEFYDVLKCDLSDYIPKLEKNNQQERYFIAWKLAKGLRVLQDHQIVHCDIKPENILMDEKKQPVIADFETIQFLGKGHAEIQSKGFTTRWAPPELISQNIICFGTDIWSLGCIILNLFTGIKSWGKTNNPNQISEFIQQYSSKNEGPLDYHNDNYRQTNPIPQDIKKVIADCFLQNYNNRKNAKDLEKQLEELYFIHKNQKQN